MNESTLAPQEIDYLNKLEHEVDRDIEPFIALSANLHVGYGGDCTPELAAKCDSWVRETLFRAALLKDIMRGEILVGWDEDREDVVVSLPPDDSYREAFQEALAAVKEFAEKLKSA
jgi:hypothetical protein